MEHSSGDAIITGGELGGGQDGPVGPAKEASAAPLQARAAIMFSGATGAPVASGEAACAQQPTRGLLRHAVAAVAKLPSALFDKDAEGYDLRIHPSAGAPLLANWPAGVGVRNPGSGWRHAVTFWWLRAVRVLLKLMHIILRQGATAHPAPAAPARPPHPAAAPAASHALSAPIPHARAPPVCASLPPLSGRRRRSLPQRSSQVARATFRFLCRLFSFF